MSASGKLLTNARCKYSTKLSTSTGLIRPSRLKYKVLGKSHGTRIHFDFGMRGHLRPVRDALANAEPRLWNERELANQEPTPSAQEAQHGPVFKYDEPACDGSRTLHCRVRLNSGGSISDGTVL